MINCLPSSLTHFVKVIDTVCQEIDPGGHFRPYSDGRWVRLIHLATDEDIQRTLLMLDEDPPLLTVYVILQLEDSAKHALNLSQAITKANYGLLPGCFEIDHNTGETRYRNSLNIKGDTITPLDVAQLISGALMMTKNYAPALRKIIRTEINPLDAIKEVERTLVTQIK